MHRSQPPVATYSICACDLEAGQWGVATQSKFLAVGSVVPWAEPYAGAVATQSYANPRYGPDGLALLRDGADAQTTVDRLVSADEDRELRQVGVVDREGGSATFTGSGCHGWAGGRTGAGYAAQGNLLVSGETVDAMAASFERSTGSPLADRLVDALAAAQEAGGDRRGQQSAALLVVERDGGYGALSDVLVDLRVDDHPEPMAELRRLHAMHRLLFGVTPREEWIPVAAALREEIDAALATLGHTRLTDWAGVANLEERVDGEDAIDPVVLAEPGARREALVAEPFTVRRLDDVEGYTDEGMPQWHMLRHALGITAFGINAWRSTAAGQTVIGEHTETGEGAGGHEELYLVLEGRATFTVDGVGVPAPRGTLVFVRDPDARRSAVAEEAGTVVLAIGGRPGRPFTISSWERSAEALKLWRTGEWDRAVELLTAQLAEDPGNANVLYNLACAESRGGRTDDALRHLNAAVGLDARFAGLAATDTDLDDVRHDPRFPPAPLT